MTHTAAPAQPTQPWRPTWAMRRTVSLLVLLTGITLVSGVPFVALLAMPLAVGATLAWADRPGRAPELEVAAPRLAEQRAETTVRMTISPAPSVQLATVRAPYGVRHTEGRLVGVVPGETGKELTFPVDTDRWGISDFGMTALVASGPDGLVVTNPVHVGVGSYRVVPTVQTIPAAELPARAASHVGAHRTRRPGEGSELLDIRQFQSGDRLRRIDWRVSARREALYVRRTAVDADADLVICLDARMDIGHRVSDWAERSSEHDETGSLDATVRITSALAGTYLRLGDRVGLVNLVMPESGVPLGSGRRQLSRIRWHLANLAPAPHTHRLAARVGAVPPGAVVVVISPLLDETATNIVATLARSHRDVIALDVLPQPLAMPTREAMRAAIRLILAERDHRLRMLRQHGVIVTAWEPTLLGRLIQHRQRARRSS